MATAVRIEDREGDDPIAALLLKLRRRDGLTGHEADVLREAATEIETLPAETILTAPNEPLTRSTLLIEGFVSRYKELSEGQRQITELHVAGDFIDLHGYLLKRVEHHIGALTPIRVAYVPHAALTRITETEPHLARMLWLSSLMDSAIQRERMLSIGRRSALGRIAHLICELAVRLEVVGQSDGGGFRFPVTQMDLADATGLTSVHVNRMLRTLRSEGLMTFRNGMVEVHDRLGLERVADFDPAYLFLSTEPR